MRIACPYCKAVLSLKGRKPGQFEVKCPGCGKVFALTVPEDETGTLSVQRIDLPTAGPGSKTERVPMVPRRIPPAANPAQIRAPESTQPAAQPTPKRKLTDEERAALILEGKDPADYEDEEGD
jgi:phage FluMu protein Com